MASEILLYSSINERSSVDFINSINELEPGNELNMRMNTPGGNPEYGWGMVAKFAEFDGRKTIKVDGQAHSMGLMFLAYANKEDIEILDVAEGVLHRAAYPDWFESSSFFTEALKGNLQRINNSLMTAVKNRIDVNKFEELKGVKLKDVFSMDDRIDVFLTAQEMKDIGLVGKINKITPKKASELLAMGNNSTKIITLAAEYNNKTENNNNNPNSNLNNNSKMTSEELRSQHPSVYTEIFNAGVANEKDRSGAWLAHIEADPKAVAEGINGGEQLSQTKREEFFVKQNSIDALKTMKNGSTKNIVSPESTSVETELTAEEKVSKSIEESFKPTKKQ